MLTLNPVFLGLSMEIQPWDLQVRASAFPCLEQKTSSEFIRLIPQITLGPEFNPLQHACPRNARDRGAQCALGSQKEPDTTATKQKNRVEVKTMFVTCAAWNIL